MSLSRPSIGVTVQHSRRSFLLGAAASTALATGACGSGSSGAAGSGKATLVLYNAQHENLMKAVTDAFTKATGIAVTTRNGDDSEMSNQIVQEGASSPADVFVTENSPGMTLVASKGLFAPLDASTLAQTPARFSATDGRWTGFAARSTVLPYNPSKISVDAVPASIMDFQDAAWKGRFGVAPAGADFQAIVSAVLQLKGEQATAAWLQGLKANARTYRSNTAIMAAVNAGEVETGVIYHYYWYEDRAAGGTNSKNVELKFLAGQDPGGFLSVSGAGVLASSKRPAEAQQLVAFLTSAAGQRAIAGSPALEYTIASDVPANPQLKPLAQLQPPTVDVTALNGPKVVQLMQQAGLI